MSKVNKLFSAPVDGTKVELASSSVALGGWQILNTTAAVSYVQVFNLRAADVSVGVTAPYFSIPLPASSGATLFLGGLAMSNGITIACTTGPSNAVSSNAYVLMTLTL